MFKTMFKTNCKLAKLISVNVLDVANAFRVALNAKIELEIHFLK